MSKDALFRHRGEHMIMAAVTPAQREASVLDRMEALANRVEARLTWAERSGSHAAYATVAKEYRQALELIARLRKELADGPQVNIGILPEWQRTRVALLEALMPHPEARAAVSEALLALEAGDGTRG
ncbi:MAG TPA: hypothetical protein VGS09_03295 [Actinomycetota bacterium]|jgi:hypothetical protein|nr:hypothetical protein [Actinomycetota bacterium]